MGQGFTCAKKRQKKILEVHLQLAFGSGALGGSVHCSKRLVDLVLIFGTDQTYAALRAKYTWPHMYHGVDQDVLKCDACQKNKSSHQMQVWNTVNLLKVNNTMYQ